MNRTYHNCIQFLFLTQNKRKRLRFYNRIRYNIITEYDRISALLVRLLFGVALGTEGETEARGIVTVKGVVVPRGPDDGTEPGVAGERGHVKVVLHETTGDRSRSNSNVAMIVESPLLSIFLSEACTSRLPH